MLAVNAAAVLVGAGSLAALAEWASDAPWQVLAALGVGRDPLTRRRHVPGEATIRWVLARVDGDAVDTTVGAWLADRLRPPAGDADARSPSTCSRQQAPRSPMNGDSREGVWEEDVGNAVRPSHALGPGPGCGRAGLPSPGL